MIALRLGTRGSPLALWQANTVAANLQATGHQVEIVRIRTSGDRLQEAPLSEIGGKRLFVKEIEDALLGGAIDVAVHSAKDMSVALPDGLAIAAVLPREDPRDALVLPDGAAASGFDDILARLGDAPAIGTSSVRRSAQLALLLPRARFSPLRGNVDTRLRRLDTGGFDAIVLACAGMRRLGIDRRISAAIPVERCIPAPGQGIVAVEIRSDDAGARAAVGPISDPAAATALAAERAVVTALGGGCQLPLGAIASAARTDLEMLGIVTAIDGARAVRRAVAGPASDPEGLGRRLADELARGGATAILDEIRRAPGPVEGSY